MIAHSTLPGYVSYRFPPKTIITQPKQFHFAGTSLEGPGLSRACARCSWSPRPLWTSGTCWTRPPGCSASMRRRPGQNRASDMRYFKSNSSSHHVCMRMLCKCRYLHTYLGASFLQESFLQPWTLQR